MSQAILAALKALDVSNDNHWTADGLPRLDTVKMTASDQTLTREAVEAAAPGFTRKTAEGYELPPAPPADPATPPAPPEDPAAAQAPQPPAQGDEGAGQGDSGTQASESTPAAPQPAANPDPASPPAEAEQGEVDGGAEGAADEIEALEAELEAATEATAFLRGEVDRVTKEFKAAQEAEDAARQALEAALPPDTETNAIQGYLASQRRILADRAARQQAIKDSGVDLKALTAGLARAPIDQAMARKTGRGSKRPSR